MYASKMMNGFGPLHGVKIVELAEWVAAPAAVRCLAEMGAEVIKVENPHGDPQRTQCYGFGGRNTERCDPTYENVNANKDFISLNLKSEDGLRIMKDILSTADVFVNGLRTKALVKLGLDYETLHEQFPLLIWAQMRGYGEWSEMRNEPGYDAVCWGARGGVMNTFRQAGESPAIPPQGFGDFNAAAIFAGGICAALFDRTRTGVGDKVVTNLYHVALWGAGHGIQSQEFGADYPLDRTRARNPFNNSFKTKDGEWFLICLPDYNRYFEKMMRMLGKEELLGDPTIQTLDAVSANHKEAFMAEQIGEAFARKDWGEWDRIMLEEEVPHQKLFRFTDILADEVCYDDDSLRRYKSLDFGPRAINTAPLRFGQYGDPPVILSKPIGYYTARYLKDAFGYSDEKIAQLEAEGAIRCWHGEDLDGVPVIKSKRQLAGEADCYWEHARA